MLGMKQAKQTLICLLSIMLLIFSLNTPVVAIESKASVTLTLGTVSPSAANTIVTVPITVSEVGNIVGYGLKLDYDRSKLEFNGWEDSGTVFGTYFNLVTTKSSTTDVNTNMLKPAIAYVARNGNPISNNFNTSGSGIIGKIRFKILAAGANMPVAVMLSDISGEVSVDDSVGSMNVNVVDGGLPTYNPTPMVDKAANASPTVMPAVPQGAKEQSNVTKSIMTNKLVPEVKLLPGSFADVQNHWARADIEFMAARKIVSGVSQNTFAPDKVVSRAEFAALLVRALGLSDKSDQKPQRFGDVLPDSWFYRSVEIAASANLISGVGTGKFAPDESVTREQMAIMINRALIRFGDKQDINEEQSKLILNKFSDNGQISIWARKGVAKVVDLGIIKGRSAGRFDPINQATRAESTVMIKNMMGTIGR